MIPRVAILLVGGATAALAGAQAPPDCRTGVDVLVEHGCRELQGRRVGLITNPTGRTRDGRRTVDVLAQAEGVQLLALFSPEHGWQGVQDGKVDDGRDAATGLPVRSLYGQTRKPTAAMLAGLDTLVIDLQDIGCRFYTYASTLTLALQAAGEHGLRCVVLDRPNPLGGVRIEGPLLVAGREDFVGCHTIPVRHGLTLGELARLYAGETGLKVDLQVIACTGWRRDQTFELTGLPWTDPSPNMRSLRAAVLYPGVGLLEGTNLSVGRGTDTPFELVGAPWCDGVRLARTLAAGPDLGIAVLPTSFTPRSSRFQGELCHGIGLLITDWRGCRPVEFGLRLAVALRAQGEAWQTERLDWLLKHPPTAAAVLQCADLRPVLDAWQADAAAFARRRAPFLLYP